MTSREKAIARTFLILGLVLGILLTISIYYSLFKINNYEKNYRIQ
jgi:uncharacterized membrane protein